MLYILYTVNLEKHLNSDPLLEMWKYKQYLFKTE